MGEEAKNIIETEIVYEPDPINELTDEEIEELCCEPVDPFIMCFKTGKIEPWPGEQDHFPQSAKDAIEKAKNDPLFEVVFESRTSPCGFMETNYEAVPCCDDPTIPELIYDEDASADVIDRYGWGMIKYEGGKPPYRIRITGQGFYTNSSHSSVSLETELDHFFIYGHDACGFCDVEIEDSCKTVINGDLKSTYGVWSQIVNQIGPDNFHSWAEAKGLFLCSYFTTDKFAICTTTWGRYSISSIGTESINLRWQHISSINGLWGGGGTPTLITYDPPEYPGVQIPTLYSFRYGTCAGSGPSGDWTCYHNRSGSSNLYEYKCP